MTDGERTICRSLRIRADSGRSSNWSPAETQGLARLFLPPGIRPRFVSDGDPHIVRAL